MVGVGSEGVSAELVQLPLEQDPLSLYEACRTYDLRAVWIERVLEFFRSKLDQRDGGDYRELLMAADQVVWSCYRPPIERSGIDAAEQGARISVVPLPFVESRYALEAFPATTFHRTWPRTPGVVSETWNGCRWGWSASRRGVPARAGCLVLVAHEVGHTLQDELAPDLTDEFAVRDRLCGGRRWDANWWRRWSREIFADVVSVLLAGPWALRALIELEKRAPQQMLPPRPLPAGRDPAQAAGARRGGGRSDAAWVLELLLPAPRPRTQQSRMTVGTSTRSSRRLSRRCRVWVRRCENSATYDGGVEIEETSTAGRTRSPTRRQRCPQVPATRRPVDGVRRTGGMATRCRPAPRPTSGARSGGQARGAGARGHLA